MDDTATGKDYRPRAGLQTKDSQQQDQVLPRSVITALLAIGGVESNPGPKSKQNGVSNGISKGDAKPVDEVKEGGQPGDAGTVVKTMMPETNVVDATDGKMSITVTSTSLSQSTTGGSSSTSTDLLPSTQTDSTVQVITEEQTDVDDPTTTITVTVTEPIGVSATSGKQTIREESYSGSSARHVREEVTTTIVETITSSTTKKGVSSGGSAVAIGGSAVAIGDSAVAIGGSDGSSGGSTVTTVTTDTTLITDNYELLRNEWLTERKMIVKKYENEIQRLRYSIAAERGAMQDEKNLRDTRLRKLEQEWKEEVKVLNQKIVTITTSWKEEQKNYLGRNKDLELLVEKLREEKEKCVQQNEDTMREWKQEQETFHRRDEELETMFQQLKNEKVKYVGMNDELKKRWKENEEAYRKNVSDLEILVQQLRDDKQALESQLVMMNMKITVEGENNRKHEQLLSEKYELEIQRLYKETAERQIIEKQENRMLEERYEEMAEKFRKADIENNKNSEKMTELLIKYNEEVIKGERNDQSIDLMRQQILHDKTRWDLLEEKLKQEVLDCGMNCSNLKEQVIKYTHENKVLYKKLESKRLTIRKYCTLYSDTKPDFSLESGDNSDAENEYTFAIIKQQLDKERKLKLEQAKELETLRANCALLMTQKEAIQRELTRIINDLKREHGRKEGDWKRIETQLLKEKEMAERELMVVEKKLRETQERCEKIELNLRREEKRNAILERELRAAKDSLIRLNKELKSLIERHTERENEWSYAEKKYSEDREAKEHELNGLYKRLDDEIELRREIERELKEARNKIDKAYDDYEIIKNQFLQEKQKYDRLESLRDDLERQLQVERDEKRKIGVEVNTRVESTWKEVLIKKEGGWNTIQNNLIADKQNMEKKLILLEAQLKRERDANDDKAQRENQLILVNNKLKDEIDLLRNKEKELITIQKKWVEERITFETQVRKERDNADKLDFKWISVVKQLEEERKNNSNHNNKLSDIEAQIITERKEKETHLLRVFDIERQLQREKDDKDRQREALQTIEKKLIVSNELWSKKEQEWGTREENLKDEIISLKNDLADITGKLNDEKHGKVRRENKLIQLETEVNELRMTIERKEKEIDSIKRELKNERDKKAEPAHKWAFNNRLSKDEREKLEKQLAVLTTQMSEYKRETDRSERALLEERREREKLENELNNIRRQLRDEKDRKRGSGNVQELNPKWLLIEKELKDERDRFMRKVEELQRAKEMYAQMEKEWSTLESQLKKEKEIAEWALARAEQELQQEKRRRMKKEEEYLALETKLNEERNRKVITDKEYAELMKQLQEEREKKQKHEALLLQIEADLKNREREKDHWKAAAEKLSARLFF